MIATAVDRLVGVFSPQRALNRTVARRALASVEQRGYEAGKKNNWLKKFSPAREPHNAAPLSDVQNTRWRAWELYRNNVHARKVVHAIIAHTLGCGLTPESQAVDEDGKPLLPFRRRAKELWKLWCRQASYKGLPGRGGFHWYELQQIQLRSTILSGESLLRFRPVSDRTIPLTVELVSSERLADDIVAPGSAAALPPDHELWRGIEFDSKGRRVAYHLYRRNPSDPIGWFGMHRLEIQRIVEDEIRHLYLAEDEEAERGVSWFAPNLMELRDLGTYKENELMASAVAACVTLGVRRSSGQDNFGTQAPSDWPTTDDDGNNITWMQPGQIWDLGKDGDIKGFSPERPNSEVSNFSDFLLRGVAGSFPGLKPSTVTGNYKQSSFASERSADNDTWRELEQLQDWMVWNSSEPVWEAFLDASAVAGLFDDVLPSPEYYATNRERLIYASWNGPVAKSINPKDDEAASALAIRNGTSTIQKEAANRGYNWRENLEELAEYVAYAREQGLPETYIQSVLGQQAQADASEPSNVSNGAD